MKIKIVFEGFFMTKKTKYILMAIFLVLPLLIDPAVAGITNTEIKAASKSWVSTIGDWTPGLTFAGFVMAAIMFFVNKYTYAIGALGGSAFLYAAKAFTGTGEAALTSAASIFLG